MIPPALARRRAHEALQEERLAYVDHNAKASQVVSFEHRTAKRIAATNICRKAAIFRQKDLQKLQDRQKAMEELYKREMAEWEQQVKEKTHRLTNLTVMVAWGTRTSSWRHWEAIS